MSKESAMDGGIIDIIYVMKLSIGICPKPFGSFILRCVTQPLHHTPRTTPNPIMTPRPIKAVESRIDFQEEAALLVVVADDVGTLEVEVKVEVVIDGAEVEALVVLVVVVVGTGGNDKVGCPEARLQNCCPRVSIADTWLEQFANTQSTSWAG